jgi:glycosyltransferase involved in cell wall biosynthesis
MKAPPQARLAIVVSHPTQYYSPWFAYVEKTKMIELRVFYLWDFGVRETKDPLFQKAIKWDVDLLSGYQLEWVPNTSKQPGTTSFSGLTNPTLVTRLAAYGPSHVLLFGYQYRAHLEVVMAARKHGWILMFRGDSHLLGRPRIAWWKRQLLTLLYRRFDRILPVGQANQAYFEYFGVGSDRLFFSPHAVDAERFAQPIKKEVIERARTDLGADDETKIILFSGKLHREKAPLTLLRAFADLNDHNCLLVFAGSGPEREALAAAVDERNLENVAFLPFANQTEMPLRYACADLFVLPSEGLYETWGLAVNEAMHSGVPCVVSDRVGCHRDLVDSGETGWVFPAGDTAALTQTLSKALDALNHDACRNRLQANVRQKIAHYTYRQTTDGLMQAVDVRADTQP